ncbi:MAG: hypothetical protein ACTSYO_08775 [Candidatus Ranarchaeia archaeon]
MVSKVTVSAKIDAELRKKLSGLGIKPSDIIKNALRKEIEKHLKRMKIDIVRPRQSAIVKPGQEGPLEEGMETLFERIGNEIAESLRSPLYQ